MKLLGNLFLILNYLAIEHGHVENGKVQLFDSLVCNGVFQQFCSVNRAVLPQKLYFRSIRQQAGLYTILETQA